MNDVATLECDPSETLENSFCLQRAALKFQINLHFLFLHDGLQLCGSSGILIKEIKHIIITIQFSSVKLIRKDYTETLKWVILQSNVFSESAWGLVTSWQPVTWFNT